MSIAYDDDDEELDFDGGSARVPTFIKVLPDAILPDYQTKGASGFDFHAYEDYEVPPLYTLGADGVLINNGGVTVRTGICVQLMPDFEVQVRGRSGLAFKRDILTQFGTIDDDYTGEIAVRLWNLGGEPLHVKKGDRIAQGVLMVVRKARWLPVEQFDRETERGKRGFGHTGI